MGKVGGGETGKQGKEGGRGQGGGGGVGAGRGGGAQARGGIVRALRHHQVVRDPPVSRLHNSDTVSGAGISLQAATRKLPGPRPSPLERRVRYLLSSFAYPAPFCLAPLPQAATESYDAHRSQLAAQLSSAQGSLEELRAQCLRDVGLLQRRHVEEVAAARAQADTAAGGALGPPAPV